MRIGLATWKEMANLNIEDKLLATALKARGAEAVPIVWTDNERPVGDVDALVIRSCWDYHNHLSAFLRWVRQWDQAGIPVFNSPSTLHWNVDKTYLRDLEQKGVAIVPTLWWTRGTPLEKIDAQIGERGWDDLVIKAAVGGTAQNLVRIPRSEIRRHLAEIESWLDWTSVLVQPFLKGVQKNGEWSFIFIDGIFSHSLIKVPATGDFRVQHEHGGSYHHRVAPAAFLAIAEKAMRAAPAELYCRVDCIEEEGELLLGELEMVEPYLHFPEDPGSENRFADALVSRLHALGI